MSKSACFILWLSRLLLIDGFLEQCWIANRPSLEVSRWHLAAGSGGDAPQRRTRQVRRKSRNRHPRHYWQDVKNVETELREFWTSLGATLPCNKPPPIPNEALLNHFERNDLRYAVVSYGGRKSLSARLGGASIMPGRWTVAVQSSPQLQQLLSNASHGLSPDLPPLSPQQKKQERFIQSRFEQKQSSLSEMRNQTRWNHSEGRKPRGYWTIELVIREL